MYGASCQCGTGRSFDAKIVKLGCIYFGHVRWVSLKMGHVGPIVGPFCGTAIF